MPTDILIKPQSIVFSGNPIILQLRNADVHIVKYQFHLIHFTSPSTAVAIASWQQVADYGTADTYTFQFESIVQDNLGFDLHTARAGGYIAAEHSVFSGYVVAFGLNNTGSTVTGSMVVTDTFTAINGGLNVNNTTSIEQYFIENHGKSFLSNAPRNKPVGLYDNEFIGLLSKTGAVNELEIRTQHKINGQQQTTININALGNDKKGAIGVGPENLNSIVPGIIDENTVSYDILALNGVSTFRDGDLGNFTSGISGFEKGSATVHLTHSTAMQAFNTGSMKAALKKPTAIERVWESTTLLELEPNTEYEILCWLYFDPQNTVYTTGFFRFGTQGFTGAKPVWAQADFTTVYTPIWQPMQFFLRTANDATGTLVLDVFNCAYGDVVYVDSISVKRQPNNEVIRSYVIDHDCHINPTRVHFLNRLGAMDSFTFTGTENRRVKSSASTYTKRLVGNPNSFGRGQQVMHKNVTESLICTTGVLSPDEMLWLEELLTSPEVYIEENGEYKPVILTDGSFTTVDRQQNIHKLKVELERANPATIQRT